MSVAVVSDGTILLAGPPGECAVLSQRTATILSEALAQASLHALHHHGPDSDTDESI